MLTDILERRSDYFVLNLYFIIGFRNMFVTPQDAYEAGVATYMALYTAVLLLIGIPAYVDESSHMMVAPLGEVGQRWHRGYSVVMLMQATQIAVAMAFRLSGAALLELYLLVERHGVQMLPLYVQNCSFHRGPAAAGHSDDHIELLPSCELMDQAMMGCEMQSLFSSKHQVLLFSTILLSVFVPLYAMLFGKSFSTQGIIGRLYLALIILLYCTLSLHFYGALPTSKEKVFAVLNGNETGKKLLNGILLSCIESLGLGSFCITIICSKVGDRVKQNFVWLAAAICFSDFGASALFSVVNVMRISAMQTRCDFNSSSLDEFLKPPSISAEKFGSVRMGEVAKLGTMSAAESIMMFRETSGYVPWTVLLPFHIMSLAFTTMIMCNCFYICDLQAAALFKHKKCCIVLLSVTRFALLIALELMHMTGFCPEMEELMLVCTTLIFYMLRMVQCVMIHRQQGFTEFLLARRRLISSANYIQQFVFEWYIGPAIFYLYNFGYPLLCILTVLNSKGEQWTQFAIYFGVANVLPSSLIMIASHIW